MSRSDDARLLDIVEAIGAIQGHLSRGDLSDGLIYDAVRARLIEIGEAVKGIDPQRLENTGVHGAPRHRIGQHEPERVPHLTWYNVI